MSTQASPIQVAQAAPVEQPQQQPLNPYVAQAQAAFSNPAASTVPAANPIAGLANHPMVKSILDALASAASAYGWTSMPPQQRLEAQNLEAQKAEAMAKLSQGERQLGYEGQRVGFEGQRTAADVQRSGAEANRANVEAGEAPKRTAIEQQTANTAQQRADQEYETKKRELDNQTKQLQNETLRTQSEYGKGGLRSQEVAANASRAATDAKMATIADAREKAEADYRQSQARAAGLQTDRATLEDERKARLAAVHDHYGQNRWYVPNSWTLQWQQEKEKEINDEIDKRIAQAEKAAGTGVGAAAGGQGGVLAQPGSSGAANPSGGTVPTFKQWQQGQQGQRNP